MERTPDHLLAPRVLVVDDEPLLTRSIRDALCAEGMDVDIAHDGATALNMATNNEYDVIVLDLMLPDLDGLSVCAELRALGDQTRVIMLTARDGSAHEVTALDTGADDYLTKPFSLVVLIAHIHALIRRRQRDSTSNRIVAGDLVMDLNTQRVYRDDIPITVTALEYALLEYMTRNVGLILSKRQILNNVWGNSFDGDPNIVEVYIAALRQKIDKSFGRRSIVTVRGIGYQLTADVS